MCLETTMTTPVIADHDIEVYKVVREDRDGNIRAPYKDWFYYRENVEAYSWLGNVSPSEEKPGIFLVDEGLHSIGDKLGAVTECVDWDSLSYHVHRAIIPAGAKYYKGHFDKLVSYASDRLILKERVI